VSVSEGLSFNEASESNEATTKKKESNKEKAKDLFDMSTRQKYENNKEALQ
jgi:hypothetical protein